MSERFIINKETLVPPMSLEEVKVPEGFQKIGVAKDPKNVMNFLITDEASLGFKPGAGVVVIGRYPDLKTGFYKYAVEVHDMGNPIYGIKEEDIKKVGFVPEYFEFIA